MEVSEREKERLVSVRRVVGSGVERVVGTDRAARIRQTEARARRRLIRALDVEGRNVPPRKPAKKGPAKKAGAKKAAAKKAAPKRTRAQLIDELGRATPEGLGEGSTLPDGLHWAAPDPFPDYPRTQGDYKTLLAGLHERLRPRTYVEVGVSVGKTLTLSRARTIAVDPAYRILMPLRCDLAAFPETSDDFFARPDAFDHFEGVPTDLAFIDGMHLAEYALRDFINMEKQMAPGGVIVLDDMLPRNSLEAFRVRRTRAWAGDVFKVHEVLRTHRPDLTLIPISTEPTGSYLVVGLDPSNTVLEEVYDSLVSFLTSPDPQEVDPAWADRHACYDPDVVLGSGVFEEAARLRDAGAGREEFDELWRRLAALPYATAAD